MRARPHQLSVVLRVSGVMRWRGMWDEGRRSGHVKQAVLRKAVLRCPAWPQRAAPWLLSESAVFIALRKTLKCVFCFFFH